MTTYDLLLKNGTVIDGQKTPRYAADIAIKGGKIAKIGKIQNAKANRIFDAKELIVAPGFIDLHTHFDSQIFWDPYCTMSGWHGVTSVVIGNCGFGFAPVKPEDRKRSMLTLERNEAIRATTMAAGMPWDWVTFPEFLDSMQRTPKGVNVLSYMGLAPLMSWVMGLENAKGRPATPEEQKAMCELLGEAMDAGACGFSAQIMGEDSVQRDYDGTPMITDIMSPDDLIAFARVLREKGKGFIQVLGADFELFEKVAEISGRPVIWNTLEFGTDQHGNTYGYWRDILKWLEDCNSRGNQIYGHAVTCNIESQFSLDEWNLFDGIPSWRDVTLGTVEERMQKMSDPILRAQLKEDFDSIRAKQKANPTTPINGAFFTAIVDMVLAQAQAPEHQKLEGYTIGEIAKQQDRHPVDAMLDISVSESLKTVFQRTPPETDMEAMRETINSPFILPGLSDGGAHMKFLTTGRYPTDFIGRLVRDNNLMDLEQAHWRLSGYSAMAAGFTDRGFLREGSPADIIVYDYDNLNSLPPERLFDFPENDWRLVQKSEGYRLTIVNGEVTFEDGECTKATPGKLLRHGYAD